MKSDSMYYADPRLGAARRLQRAGDWSGALRLTPEGTPGAVLRAEILVDRHTWSLDPVDEALAAIEATALEEPAAAAFLTAVLEYWRQLFRSGPDALGPDPVAEFKRLDGQVGPGWAVFWHGVTLENLRGERQAAQAAYRRALAAALEEGDLLLESYVVRHQGFHLLEQDREAGLALLRRSIDLRAACGARPHVAAAQAALAEALGVGPESVLLNRLVARSAQELNLVRFKAPAPLLVAQDG
ncbi:hypothetical protein KGA66_08745 [Actinocrinis puniceicyclus]|uniref:Uncharacterized protein n=1 Tax=Actinocrinis puniceicyclus TaxID=977794 RepID=A0A8J8BC39_9ACTN|nr:hypothetical protein [Actinocrinis puniceicyclus]MBS2963130.1 hypothetical protein [Actinocrinis puniceicyclus]